MCKSRLCFIFFKKNLYVLLRLKVMLLQCSISYGDEVSLSEASLCLFLDVSSTHYVEKPAKAFRLGNFVLFVEFDRGHAFRRSKCIVVDVVRLPCTGDFAQC